MPLAVLLPTVLIGILGIAAILHIMGLTAPRRLTGPTEALAAWEREFPEQDAIEAHLSADQKAALILLRTGETGLVWCLGADTVARSLEGADFIETERGMDIYLHDMSAPHVSVALLPQDRPRWMEYCTA